MSFKLRTASFVSGRTEQAKASQSGICPDKTKNKETVSERDEKERVVIEIYIHPFWAGVLITIIVEVIVVMITAFIDMKREEGDDNEKSS